MKWRNLMFDEYPDLMNVKHVCAILQIGKNYAYQLLQSHELKSKKIGKGYKIPKAWLIDYIKK